jgi:hypothetical protein
MSMTMAALVKLPRMSTSDFPSETRLDIWYIQATVFPPSPAEPRISARSRAPPCEIGYGRHKGERGQCMSAETEDPCEVRGTAGKKAVIVE